MYIYCASSLRCEKLATAAWRRLKPRALKTFVVIMWARLLLLGCSLEVAVEGSSQLRMKTPGNTSYCCCCCFWCEESKYPYLLLLLFLIMWRVFGFVWTCRNAAAASGALVAEGSSTDAQRRCCGQGAKSPFKLVVQISNDPTAPPSDPTHPTTP
jgi:hypothetical protein